MQLPLFFAALVILLLTIITPAQIGSGRVPSRDMPRQERTDVLARPESQTTTERKNPNGVRSILAGLGVGTDRELAQRELDKLNLNSQRLREAAIAGENQQTKKINQYANRIAEAAYQMRCYSNPRERHEKAEPAALTAPPAVSPRRARIIKIIELVNAINDPITNADNEPDAKLVEQRAEKLKALESEARALHLLTEK